MTVKELIKYLETFDENLEVLSRQYSDTHLLAKSEIYVIRAASRSRIRTYQDNEQFIHLHKQSNDPEIEARAKEFLLFEGN